ncbi:MAG: hypothetical protein ACJAYB_002838 [Psychromonas sp.]|jgi:hypothetical protein
MDFPVIAKFDSRSELTRRRADLPLSMCNSGELAGKKEASTNLVKITFATEKDSRAVLRFLQGIGKGISRSSFHF